MNKQTRKQLAELRDKVDHLKSSMLDLYEEVEEIRDDESDKYYNLPENLQECKVGLALQESEEQLEALLYEFEQVESAFDSLLENFDELMEL
jgi:uncharacterized coiled-coil DUF342 family protein